ncbi:MAG: trypsin-like peptidase domain-containing protein [Acidobacteriota bacterium]
MLAALAVVAGVSACRRDHAHVSRRARALVPVTQTAPTPTTPPSHTQVRLPSGQSIADVAARVTPSVVNVFSEREQPFEIDPFGGFIGVPRRHALSLGSGVIVSPDGIIVTNHHVVEKSDAIAVVLKDGRELGAKLVGTDPRSDVAVLRIDAKNLPAIQLADSSKIRVGDLVLAIGNPFGIGQTVTMGIISATGRANLGINDVEDFIQTDAAINPGNSGGALVDMNGRLIGINTAIMSRSGGYQGIGFAIPSNMVVQIEDQLLRHGKVTRGWLGVAIDDVTDSVAMRLHVAPRSGVVVTELSPEGPAARAGLALGDVILSVNGVRVTDPGHLRNLVALAGPHRVHLEIVRGGKEQGRDVQLVQAPDEPVKPTADADAGDDGSP